MVKKALIFFIGFLCAWILFSVGMNRGVCQTSLPPNVSFYADSSNFYFFDRDDSKIYKYSTQGKFTHTYIVKELGKDFISK
jgi:hypothetical protein